jgi:hypothetical protein
MTIDERRSAIAEVVDCAFVVKGHGPVGERVIVYLRGQGPMDLPRIRPRRHLEHRPFDPATAPPPARPLAPGERWSERRLRRELEPFTASREDWPSFPTFQAAGLGLVYAQVVLHGGPIRWARQLGLRYEGAPKPLAGWSEERVRTELGAFLRDTDHWPTSREFAAAGHQQLRHAIVRFGGQERWAAEFGIAVPPAQRPTRAMWTEERIEATLRNFLAGRSYWPPRKEFTEAGLLSLCRSIGAGPERHRWARRLGVRVDPRVTRAKTDWTEARIERTLRGFLRGHHHWPSIGEFRSAGLYGLHQRIGRSPGGHDAWARRYGLPRASATPLSRIEV